MRILDAAKERGITIRLMGAAAMRVHCPGSVGLHEVVLNRVLSDRGFMTYRRHIGEVRMLLQGLNYFWDEVIARAGEGEV